MVKLLSRLTPAKINLFLRIVGRRPDGYHLLDSVFLPISLYDRVRLEMRSAARGSVALRCNWPELPVDERNLATRAAIAFIAEFGLRAQVTIDLEKGIPVGAGLGTPGQANQCERGPSARGPGENWGGRMDYSGRGGRY